MIDDHDLGRIAEFMIHYGSSSVLWLIIDQAIACLRSLLALYMRALTAAQRGSTLSINVPLDRVVKELLPTVQPSMFRVHVDSRVMCCPRHAPDSEMHSCPNFDGCLEQISDAATGQYCLDTLPRCSLSPKYLCKTCVWVARRWDSSQALKQRLYE